jgi:hypothetical protein
MTLGRRLLIVNGVIYRRYVVIASQLYLRLKRGLRRVTPHPRGEGYLGFRVKNPISRKWQWIMAHRAILESLRRLPFLNAVASHRHGTSRSSFGPSCCDWKSIRGNRLDRGSDGTASTGHRTVPGKLASSISTILQMFDDKRSIKGIAEYFGCSRTAVRYHLAKHRPARRS